MYTGFLAVLLNLLVVVLATVVLRAVKAPDGNDGTTADDYHADEGDPRVVPGGEQYPEPVAA